MLILGFCVLQPIAEEELCGDRILESENETASLGTCPERDSPANLKVTQAVEENGEQEGEPIRNGAESVSEGEGGDGNSSCAENPSEAPTCQYKPGKSRPRKVG